MNRRVATPKFLQFQMTECAVAALGIILRYYNCCLSLDELRQRASVTRAGLNAKDIVKTARALGFTVKVLTREPGELEELGFPLLVHVNFGHFVVVEGMTEKHVYLNDPSCGPYKALRSDFEIEFTGVVFVVRPGPNAFQQGESKQLIPWIGKHLKGYKRRLAIIAIVFGARVFASLAFLFVGTTLTHSWHLLSGIVLTLMIAGLYAVEKILRERFGGVVEDAVQSELIASFLKKAYPFYTYRLPGVLLETIDKVRDLASFLKNQFADLILVSLTLPLCFVFWCYYLSYWGLIPVCLFTGGLLTLLCLDKKREPFRSRYKQIEMMYRSSARMSLDDLESHIIGSGAASLSSGLAGSYSWLMSTQRPFEISQQRAFVFTLLLAIVAAITVLGIHTLILGHGFDWQTTMLIIVTLFFFGKLLSTARGGFEEALETLERLEELTERNSLSLPETGLSLSSEDLCEQEAAIEAAREDLLTARSVNFRFGKQHPLIFEDISLSMNAGEQVGLSGRSGSGKSTFAAILAGLLTPTSGDLELAGISCSDIDSRAWTRQVSWVSPTPFLFEGSLRDNLSFWNPRVTDEELMNALKDAQLYSTIMDRPGQLNAVVENRGENFSRGQQQRLEIARAILRKPRILILDEALDALEEELEIGIRRRLRERGMALLVVSHREESLAACDRCYKLEKGRLVEENRSELGGIENAAGGLVDKPIEESESFDCTSAKSALEELVGEKLNFEGLDSSASVLSLARGVGVMLRPIDLRVQEWWRTISEPIFAVLAAEQQSVILWPSSAGLRLYEKETKTWRWLDEESAGLFEDIAYLRIHPYPTQLMGPWKLGLWLLSRQKFDFCLCLVSVATAALFIAFLPHFFQQLAPTLFIDGGLNWLWAFIYCFGGLISVSAVLRSERRLSEGIGFQLFSAFWLRLFSRRIARIKEIPPLKLIRHMDQLLIWNGSKRQPFRLFFFFFIFLSLLIVFTPFKNAFFVATAVALLVGIGLLCLFRQAKEEREDEQRFRSTSRSFLFGVFCSNARLRGAGAEAAAFQQWKIQAEKFKKAKTNLGDALLQFYEELGFLFIIGLFLLIVEWQWGEFGPGVIVSLWLFCLGTGEFLKNGLVALERRDHWRAIEPLLNSVQVGGRRNQERLQTLKVENLSLHFPGVETPVFRQLSFSIKAGELIAITGASGSGKSTLLRALLGFLECQEGTIQYGEHFLDELNPDQLRRHVAFVSQNERLSPANVKMNVAHEENSTLNDVKEALRLACLDKEVASWHRGMTTFTAEGQVSTGQKQRILLARAFCKKPQILFLDEATSACQEGIEREILANVKKLGITCILVTHRKRTLAHVDRCFELKDGLLRERDAHGFAVSS